MRTTPLAHALLGVCLTLSITACTQQPANDHSRAARPAAAPAAATVTQTTDVAFEALAKRYVEESMALQPVAATQVGDHRHDDQIDDLSAAGRQKALDWNRAMQAELDRIDRATLSRENQVDALIMRNALQYEQWRNEVLQDWAWDAQIYTSLAGGALYNLMARDFAPMPQRLQSAIARMEKIPQIFAQARENLDPARVPKTHAQTVAKQNKGILTLIDTFITPNAGKLQAPDRKRLETAVTKLRKAVAEHQSWLEQTLVPNANGDFRLGAERYDEKLRFSLNSALSRQEIRQRAEAELKQVRQQMYQVAQEILQGKPGTPPLPNAPTPEQQQAGIEAALQVAYADKPGRNDVVDYAKHTLDVATRFVREKNLVTVPDDPVDIILMPEFQRGFSVAYCDSPGPLDKGQKTYYAISPIPEDWDREQADSFLREYNKHMIHVLTIHEAMPGHYLEGAHSAQFPSTLRAVLRSGVFAEGWAVYTEKMMAEAGYADNDPLFRLMRLKFYARSVANAILDQGVHVDGWSKQQAMDLMVKQTFQQQSEADGKWVRAQLSSAQLPTYFVGAQEQFDTRKAVERKLGDKFDLKQYHDQILSYGAPPTRFARQLMLDEAIE